jgi:hypothetical protein
VKAVIIVTMTVNGRRILKSDMPADFNAFNSLFSAMFPIVMIEESKIANGNAKGIILAET